MFRFAEILILLKDKQIIKKKINILLSSKKIPKMPNKDVNDTKTTIKIRDNFDAK